jgi:hypothetical protein
LRVGDLRISNPQQVVLDVVTGELASRMKLDAFAEIELDLFVIRGYVPALGKHRAWTEFLVIGDQSVVDQPDAID